MRTVAVLLLVTTFLSFTNSAEGAGRRRGRSATSPASAGDARALYPKYYGGFHARALQNIGIPTGDIGLRGNGIYANPW